MNRRIFAPLLTLLLVGGLSVGMAHAQGGGGGRGFGGGRFGMQGGMMGGGINMLRMPEVQKELKLTPEQIAKVDAKGQEMRDKMREMFQNGGGAQDPEARQKMMADMQEMQKKAVDEILTTDEQKKRYHQLELQQMGANALTRPDVVADLKITEDQKKQIESIRSKAMEDMRASMQGQDFQSMTADERNALRTKMQDAQKATNEKILGVLTEDQKKQWKDMQGEPFKFPPMRGFGGGRRPGGAAGGGAQ